MTAAVPDPQECRHIGKRGLDCDCDEPAVPGPRFRDQLAEVTLAHRQLSSIAGEIACACGWFGRWHTRHVADVVAAEVEARVQAEAEGQQAAHELMASQFRVMQQEKDHGWREAERWEAEAEKRLDALIAIRAERDALQAVANQRDELRKVLADLTEAVSRGDEYGLPEAYRAATAALAQPAPGGERS